MTVWYCDYSNGTDANASASNGDSFATRRKSISNIVAAVLAPGDEIRVMKSPDPTSLGITGTWTDGPLPATFVPASSTNATPIVMSKAGHGLVTGDTVIVAGHTTNTKANGVWNVTVSGDNFTLLHADGSNSIGNGTGGASGTVRKVTCGVVTLASSLTKNIACLGNRGELTNWTAVTNITNSINSTDYKEGGECQQIAVGASFTTGLAAYLTLASLDLSAYQQVSFWIKQTAGTIGLASSISLALCTDTAGATVVHTINVPFLGALSRWAPVIVDLGTNLNAAIQSVAFYVNTDNGAQTFLIDNIIACKASSSADSLNLTSLIGKNTGTEPFLAIQSIDGTRVMLDQDTNEIPTTSPALGYAGTTETVTAHKRETIKTVMVASSTTASQEVQDSGTEGSAITISGGWDTTAMTTQTGETVFDGQNGHGYGIYVNTKNYISISNFSVVRYYNGVYLRLGRSNYASIVDANNNSSALRASGSIQYATAVNLSNNSAEGMDSSSCYVSSFTATNCNSNSTGFTITSSYNNYFEVSSLVSNNSSYAVNIVSGDSNTIKLAGSDNGTSDIASALGTNYIKDSTLSSSVKVSGFTAYANAFLWSTNENNDTDTHFGYTDGGLIASTTSVRHTASGIAWSLSPTSTNRSESYPLPLLIATVAVEAGVAKTISAWFRRTNTGLTGRLICYGGQLSGVSTTSSTMTEAADTWGGIGGVPLSVTVTATQKGVLEFYAECWGGTTYTLYVDDVEIS